MINPYDLGNFQLADYTQKIHIDDLIKQAKKELKIRLIQAQIEAFGIRVNLTTSKTRYGSERLWFSCPQCKKRTGTLYRHPVITLVGCRTCLDLRYKNQRYKGMIELGDHE